MTSAQPYAMPPYAWAAIVAVALIRFLWRAKPRPLRIERMWITPSLILAGVVLSFAFQPPPRLPLLIAEGLRSPSAQASAGGAERRPASPSIPRATNSPASRRPSAWS